MPFRKIVALVAVALALAACGDPGSGVTTTEADPATTQAAPEAIKLSYDLQSGTSYSYEVDMDQTIDMTASGDASAMGEEEIPGEMSVRITGTSTFTQTVADGPEPGTFAVTISGDFSDIEFTGTIDGEPVSSEEIPDFAAMEPIETTVIVDEQGNIIPESGEELGSDLLGGLGAMGGLGALEQFGTGNLGQFIGPPLTDEEVTVGDTWSETIETPTMPGDDPISTVIESEVVGTDTVDGHEVFVIETRSTTSPIEFDLGEMLIGFFTAFVPEDATEEELTELDALTEELRFVFSVDETVADYTTRFDAQAGLARGSETSTAAHMVFDMKVPDEATGELVEFAMDMNMTSDVAFHLVEAGTT